MYLKHMIATESEQLLAMEKEHRIREMTLAKRISSNRRKLLRVEVEEEWTSFLNYCHTGKF
jgi:hypothetical protein